MTDHWVFVPGQPVAKARPRVTTIGGKPRAYTPKKTATFEALVASYWTHPAMDGAVALSVVACLPVPESWSKTKKRQAADGEIMPVSRPDVDNYAKAVMDALDGIAFKDDARVVDLIARKRYADNPGVLISLKAATEQTC